MDRLDPSKLVLAETILSFLISPFAVPPYNLPIFLFGTYAQEVQTQDNAPSYQLFTGLLGASALFDLLWISTNEQSGFIKFLTIILLLLKVPTFLALGAALRERGLHFGGLATSDVNRETVWPIPGGFPYGDRGGYQVVEDDSFVRPTKPVAPAPQNQAHAAPGAYQSV